MAERIATAFLAGRWEEEGLRQRGSLVVEDPGRWLPRLARRIHAKGAGLGALRKRQVVEWILRDPTFHLAVERYDVEVGVRVWDECPPMQPASGKPSSWRLPSIATVGALAEWLGIRVNELEWFGGFRRGRRSPTDGPLSHYRYRSIKKRHGEIRLLEIPKPRLRELQRQVLHRLLDYIPPHEAAHGFCPGRSVRSFAEPHARQRVVLRMDLADFFPTIRWRRVMAVFLTAGYPDSVAALLTGLCTNRVSTELWMSLDIPLAKRRRLDLLYSEPHLPQGAPTSPALSNLIAFRLDCRLAALAGSADARYTRYADDLAFSGGDLERSARRFHVQVAAIALEEGFTINTRKSRIMRSGTRQRLAGVVVNRHPNLERRQYDRLKAMLHNCIVHGPTGQNRGQHGNFRARLAGMVAYAEMINPVRGRRLRELFERIKW
ncbi:MAG: reverse transcriptase family protein [Pirellulales bacterium]